MPFEEGLFAYLDAYPGLTLEVGSRIYPLVLPQRPTFPAVTYVRISTPRLLEFERAFFPHPRFQFDCWAESYDRAKDVAAQVRAALNLYRGAMGAYTVQTSLVEDERDMYDPETKLWHVIIEAVIWYEE
jgi:hypothetical protein